MASLQIPIVALTATICIGMALLGGILAGDALKSWYPRLAKPWFQVPLWAFIGVGIIGYFMDGIILYRLLAYVPSGSGKVISVSMMLIVMLYNELWNGAFFRLRSTFVGFVGVVAFLVPLAMLQIALALNESTSAWLLLVYVVWVLLYDVPWAYALWRLNPA